MKYVVNERQYNLLNEIHYSNMDWGETDIEDKFLSTLTSHPSVRKLTLFNRVRDYFENVVGLDTSGMNLMDIEAYVDDIYGLNIPKKLDDSFYNKDVIGGLCYYLAKVLFGLKMGSTGLSYIETQNNQFWFFDDELEEIVGYVLVAKFNPKNWYRIYKLFPQNTMMMKLVLSDQSGYGKKYICF